MPENPFREGFKKAGLIGEKTDESRRVEAEQKRGKLVSALRRGLVESDSAEEIRMEIARKEHGVLADVGKYVEGRPMLRKALGTAAKPLGVVANLAEAGVQGLQGKGGDAMESVRRAAGLVQSLPDVDDPSNENFRSFTNVLETAGVPELGVIEDFPLLGRVTGRGILGTGMDMGFDPIRSGRIASKTTQGRRALLQVRNPLKFGNSAKTILATPKLLDDAVFKGAAAARKGMLRAPVVGEVANAFRRMFVTAEQAPETRSALVSGRDKAFRSAQALQAKGERLFDRAYAAGEKAGLSRQQVSDALTGGAEKLKQAKTKMRDLDLPQFDAIQQSIKEYRKLGFSKKESLDAARAVELLPDVDPIMAPYASQARRLMRDVLAAEQTAGVAQKALKDPTLFYMTRILTPEAQELLAASPRAAKQAKKISQSFFDAKTPAQIRRKAIYEGMAIPELNKFFREKFGDSVQFFETDPSVIVAKRLASAKKGMTAANFAQSLLDDVGRPVTPELLRSGWVASSELFDEATTGLRFARAGSKRGLHGVDLALPPEVAAVARPFMKKLADPKTPNIIAESYMSMVRAFKTGATVLFPEFLARNGMSNVIANYFGDVTNPTVYPRSASMMIKMGRGKLDDIVEFGPKDNRVRMTIQEFFDRADNDGIIGLGHSTSAAEELGGAAKLRRRDIFVTPFTDIAGKGGEGALKRTAMAAPRTVAAPFKFLARGGRMTNELLETNAKIAHMIDKLDKGIPWSDAVQSTKKHLFDYADLTPFEKSTMRNLVPFYTWTRKALPMVVDTMVRKPGKFSQMALLEKAWNRGADGAPLDTAFIPEWVDQQFRRATGDNIVFGTGNPAEVLSILDAPFDEFMGMLTPALKGVVQASTGHDLFRGRRLSGRLADSAGSVLAVADKHPVGHLFTSALDFRELREANGKGDITGYRINPHALNVFSMVPLTAAGSRGVGFMDRFAGGEQPTGTTNQVLRSITGLRDEDLTPKQRAYKNFSAALDVLDTAIEKEVQKGDLSRFGPIISTRKDVGIESPERQRLNELKSLRKTVHERKMKLIKQLQKELGR